MYHSRITNQFSTEEQWIINQIKNTPSSIPANFNIHDAHSFATKNGIAPYLYFLIMEDKQGINPELEKLLKQDYLSSLLRNTKIHSVWSEIYQLFTEHKLTAIPLKGIFLSKYIYIDSSHRPMSDIDVLFSSSEYEKAYQLLLSSGAEKSNEEVADHDEKTGHHLPGIIYKGVLIEVHKSLFPLDTNYQLPISEIWPSITKFKDTLTLSPVHNLIYLCLHTYTTMQRGGIRLSWLLDIFLLCQSEYFIKSKGLFEETLIKLKLEKPVLDVLQKTDFIFNLDLGFISHLDCKKLSNREQARFIGFIKESDQQNTNHSYTIAFERLKNTRGIKNKFFFIRSVMLSKRKNENFAFIKRTFRLMYRTLNMLFHYKRR
ncbi:nucleotidyltransferase family protein [Labilibacter sediminis]|nr:nucleotidyltransferase family protein [Labilibacter sediminis]